ncbi:peptide/nickel transport system ATP-binding protein [Paenibacillus cellulosilyticus]|uniref:Peptide/nickel transport system ATP-binding protein n=1 Tax=Paenibacillus cellulosilyticus TaxID=375489 RepID=A0A2V2Z3C6_9BACL|nr:dipeptide ABC transporter ATP-binding protein [Paenibacillus cellulosilyticus]PWW08766.1 peptide/nickel transport system ATP-binding protein [Paenibacillus cellulosilyticus]QKS48322.1 dipeptide ABC transporter ATP-binding protein [Paenibacillus cellulosilyticus]
MLPILEIKDLKKHYAAKTGLFGRMSNTVKALDGISLAIEKGKTFAIVGESGSGKTTLGKTMLRLIEPTSGSIIFNGQDIMALGTESMRKLKTDMQIVFQDPFGSLDPRWTVRRTLEEPLRTHYSYSAETITKKVDEILEVVGLTPQHALRYPYELSGGQRQRVGIARALILEPQFVVFDEPVSALDVSIQAQVLTLLQDLQSRLSLTYLFISHDLSVVRYISDHVGVMYLGKMMETGPSEQLFSNPLHPYTEALISAIPQPDPDKRRERIVLSGEVPSPRNAPSGCVFHTRCPKAMPQCSSIQPEWLQVSENRYIACHLYNN